MENNKEKADMKIERMLTKIKEYKEVKAKYDKEMNMDDEELENKINEIIRNKLNVSYIMIGRTINTKRVIRLSINLFFAVKEGTLSMQDIENGIIVAKSDYHFLERKHTGENKIYNNYKYAKDFGCDTYGMYKYYLYFYVLEE